MGKHMALKQKNFHLLFILHLYLKAQLRLETFFGMRQTLPQRATYLNTEHSWKRKAGVHDLGLA